MNSGNTFSNYVNAELKVDETFITENCIAKKRKNSNTADLSRIYCELLACKKGNSSKSGTSPLDLCTNSAEISNNSNLQINQNDVNVFSLHEEELLSILQDLQQNLSFEINSCSKCIDGYFCSDTIFYLSSKILKILKKDSRERVRFCSDSE